MNKICKAYISEVKTFFPLLGKDERDYINKLKTNVDSFCDEVDISTKEELYEQYGMPKDVMYDYYPTIDTNSIIKRIRVSRYIKCLIVIFFILSIFAVSSYCIALYHDYKIALNEEMFFQQETVVDTYISE